MDPKPKITQEGADPDPVANGSQGDGIPEEAYVPEVAKVVTRPLRQANRPWPPEADPGPLLSSRRCGAMPRRWHMTSRGGSGSRARTSTACGSPSPPVTRLKAQCMP